MLRRVKKTLRTMSNPFVALPLRAMATSPCPEFAVRRDAHHGPQPQSANLDRVLPPSPASSEYEEPQQLLFPLFYWNTGDLQQKLAWFKDYVKAARVHQGLGADTQEEKAGGSMAPVASLAQYHWQDHCQGLFRLSIAA